MGQNHSHSSWVVTRDHPEWRLEFDEILVVHTDDGITIVVFIVEETVRIPRADFEKLITEGVITPK